MKVLTRINDELSELANNILIRTLSVVDGYDFSSNDYFCLAEHPALKTAVKQGLDEFGFGATSSRFIRGERHLHAEVEQELAHFKGCERALLFNSGYMANIGVLASLIKKEDYVFSDALNHASLIDGLRLSGAKIHIFPHRDYDYVAHELKNIPKNTQVFIVTESLFSMDGDVAPLERYADLSREFGCGLIVDEAHAVGIFGTCGRGLIEHFGIGDAVLVSTNGLGKAFACVGGFAAGSETVINYITQKARTLMFTTGLPPAFLYAIKAALKIIAHDDVLRTNLNAKMQYFAGLLHEANLKPRADLSTPIFPIIVGDNKKALSLSDYAKKQGFDIRAIRPPTVPVGEARVRITINCGHSFQLLEKCVQLLRGYL